MSHNATFTDFVTEHTGHCDRFQWGEDRDGPVRVMSCRCDCGHVWLATFVAEVVG